MSDSFDPNATVVDNANTTSDPYATVVDDANSDSRFNADNDRKREPTSPAEWATSFWPDWSVVESLGGGSFGYVFEIRKTLMGYTSKAAAKIILIPKDPMAVPSDIASEDYYFQVANRMFDEIRLMSELSGEQNIVVIKDPHR